ncbi:hypothetical protein B0H10DRAFT_1960970 [Mycena sp. CBHHK59/15]|nr:hypothetical protein B0H10DRAFT_1960970 [Mycena sp. CBHHK59/15]
MNGWACGIFVIHAIGAIANGAPKFSIIITPETSSKRKLPVDNPSSSNPTKKTKMLPADDLDSSDRTKKTRAKKKNAKVLESLLKENKGISVFDAHQVFCKGCAEWIQLHKKQKFKPENWNQHEAKCPAITGQLRVRVAVKKKYTGPVVSGAESIMSFYGKPSMSSPAVEDTPEPPNKVDSKLDSDSPVSRKKNKITYESYLVKAASLLI